MGTSVERNRQDRVLAGMPQAMKDAVWEMSRPDREAHLSHLADERVEMTRRTAGGLIVGGALSLYLAAKGLVSLDRRSGEEHWPRTVTEFLRLPECEKWFPKDKPTFHPDEAFYTIGGLGCVSSIPHAEPMGKNALGLPQETTIPMSYLVTSNQGKTPEDLAKILIKEAGNSESMSFYGHSNGGPTLLEALHIAKEKYGVTIPVKRLILNCSPFDFDDAREGFFGKALAKVAQEIDYTGGEYTKFLYQLWDRLTAKGDGFIRGIKKAISESWEEASNGESPTPWLSDLYNLCNAQTFKRDFTGILTPETEILYLKSPIDNIVYNDQACAKYEALANDPRYRSKFSVKIMPPGTRHGDSEKGSREAEPWVRGPRHGGASDN